MRKCRPESRLADNWFTMGMASAGPAILSCSAGLSTPLLVMSAFTGAALIATINFVREGNREWNEKLTPGPLP